MASVLPRHAFSMQGPIRSSERSEPQPYLALSRTPLDRHADRHPSPENVLLVAEAPQASLASDRAKSG